MKQVNLLLCFLFFTKSTFSQTGEVVFPISESIKIEELKGRYLNVLTNHKFESENIVSCKWYDVGKGIIESDYKPDFDYLGVLLFRFNDTKLVSTETIKINPDKKYIPLEVYETYKVENTINILVKLYNKNLKEVYLECFSYDLKNKTTTNKRLVTVKKGTDMVVYKDKSNQNFVCLTGSKSFLDFSKKFKNFNYFVFNKNLEVINQGKNINMINPHRQEAFALDNGDLIFCNMINNFVSGKRVYKLQFYKIIKNEVKEISFNGETYMSNAKFIFDNSILKITCLSKQSPENIFNSILIGDVDLNVNKITNIKVSNFKDLGNTNNSDENEKDKKANENFEKIKDNESCNLPRMTCIMDIIYGKGNPIIFIDRLYECEKNLDNTALSEEKYISMGYGAILNYNTNNAIKNYAVLKYSATYFDISITKSPCIPQPFSDEKFIVNKNEKINIVELNNKNYFIGSYILYGVVPNYYFTDNNIVYCFKYDWTKEKISLSKKDIQ